MNNRLFLTPLALAGALLGASTGAFAQSDQGPAPANGAPQGQYQQGYPQNGQGGPNGQFGPNGPGGPGSHRPGPVKMALKTLGLSQDQRAQIRNVMRQFRESKQSQQPMTRQQMIAQVRGILTPDQQARFQDAMRRARQRMANQGQGQGQGGQFGPQGQGGPQGQYGPQGGQPGPYGPQGQGGPPDEGQQPN